MITNIDISKTMRIKLDEHLPEYPNFVENIRRAPDRGFSLREDQTQIALKNALRYIPQNLHKDLASEFMEELTQLGRIYAYRYRPQGNIKAKSINEYQGKCLEGKAFQLMMDNNLDFDVALYPYELVTYGETGQVCQNWMQYRLIQKYLQNLTEKQTLVIESGHPLGLFASSAENPRVIITNGLMIGSFNNSKSWHTATQMGVANYGQMTAGGWMYIGPQGIVHGTYNTLLHAGRLKLGTEDDLRGRLFVSSGLGGMSGAQAKSIEIAQGVGIIAETDKSRITTRHEQGWVGKIANTMEETFAIAKEYQQKCESISIAYHGNIVDLLKFAVENDIAIDLLSDQTSCHAVYDGGYTPQGISFAERTELLKNDRQKFKSLVDESLCTHYKYIKALVAKGTYFFDYGNSFMKAIFDAGVKEIAKNGIDESNGFIFPSYVEDILGPELFDYGYGPFRWVCLTGDKKDLEKTDQAAMECIDPNRRIQDKDNYIWVRDAAKNQMVVGSQARILYQDAAGRVKIALKFNEMVRKGEVGPIMLGRDHHDTGGTDSPFRETANIKDGSNVMADMAIQCFAGNAARGMSLVVLHNGGGVGIGKSINGGFGLVLDGSERIDNTIKSAISWDVMGGVARRAWARNINSVETCMNYNENGEVNHITLPYLTDNDLIKSTVEKALRDNKK
ncbi:urocanate hydratase [Candidatus Uabimicrobium sp. HlEnr_7]|uniref:urocanate hydratase n=1 Tax=Candidatus Uabimicrobium helgolandensis TaxID=3095367 RepID=UPI003557FCB2